nr:tetratricopeptide repeat protein [Rhodothermaceae bacterium]
QSERLNEEMITAQHAADVATKEAQKSEEIVGILISLFESVNPTNVPGGDTVRVSNFLEINEKNILKNLDDRPEVQARMKHVIGEMYFAQGDYGKAQALIENGLAQQVDLKGTYDKYAAEILTDLAMVHYELGRRDSTISMLRTALHRFERSGNKAAKERAYTLLTLAPLLPDGQYKEQAAMLEEANALLDELEEPDAMMRASAANQLGVFYYSQSEYAKSLEPFEKTRTFLERAVGKEHPYYLVTTGNLAGIYKLLDRLDEAKSLHLEVLEARRNLPVNNSTNVGIAWTLSQLGGVSLMQGNHGASEANHKEAYELIKTARGEDHPDISDYALPYADVLIAQKKYDQASELIEHVLRTQETHFGDQSAEYAWALYKKSYLSVSQGLLDKALQNLNQSITIWVSIYPDGQNGSLIEAQFARSVINLKLGRIEQAHEVLADVLAYKEKNDQANPTAIAVAKLWTGVALSQLGRHGEAGPLLEAGRPLLDRPFFIDEEDVPLIREAMKKSTGRGY